MPVPRTSAVGGGIGRGIRNHCMATVSGTSGTFGTIFGSTYCGASCPGETRSARRPALPLLTPKISIGGMGGTGSACGSMVSGPYTSASRRWEVGEVPGPIGFIPCLASPEPCQPTCQVLAANGRPSVGHRLATWDSQSADLSATFSRRHRRPRHQGQLIPIQLVVVYKVLKTIYIIQRPPYKFDVG